MTRTRDAGLFADIPGRRHAREREPGPGRELRCPARSARALPRSPLEVARAWRVARLARPRPRRVARPRTRLLARFRRARTADVWQGGSVGSLSVHLGARHAKASKALRAPPSEPEQPGPLAAWPSMLFPATWAAVALPTSAKVLGFSVDDVLDCAARWRATRAHLVRRIGDGGAAGAAAPKSKSSAKRLGERLRFSVMLRARSQDGSSDVRLPLRVDARSALAERWVISVSAKRRPRSSPRHRTIPPARSSKRKGYRAVLVSLELVRSQAIATRGGSRYAASTLSSPARTAGTRARSSRAFAGEPSLTGAHLSGGFGPARDRRQHVHIAQRLFAACSLISERSSLESASSRPRARSRNPRLPRRGPSGISCLCRRKRPRLAR